jgi:SAM-dependent methyltransferase
MIGTEPLDLYARRPDLYDLMHAEHVDDLRFLEEITASLGESPRVLELGCGTGRLLMPLLDAGARVVGLDRDGAMLEVARSRLALYGERVRLVEADMCGFRLDERFDLAVIGLNTFMHLLTQADQIACLEAIHRHLRPAGLLLLDLANPHTVVQETPLGVVQHRFTRPAPLDPGATVTLWSCTTMNVAEQMTQTVLFFDEVSGAGGRVQRTTAEVTLRLIYRYELDLLLARTGFAPRRLYGDYQSGPYEDGSERLICLAAALA